LAQYALLGVAQCALLDVAQSSLPAPPVPSRGRQAAHRRVTQL